MSHAAPRGRVKELLPQRDDVRTMFTHPYLIDEHIRQREQELRRSARRYTPRQPHRRHSPAGRHPVRRRAGWALIEIGLPSSEVR